MTQDVAVGIKLHIRAELFDKTLSSNILWSNVCLLNYSCVVVRKLQRYKNRNLRTLIVFFQHLVVTLDTYSWKEVLVRQFKLGLFSRNDINLCVLS